MVDTRHAGRRRVGRRAVAHHSQGGPSSTTSCAIFPPESARSSAARTSRSARPPAISRRGCSRRRSRSCSSCTRSPSARVRSARAEEDGTLHLVLTSPVTRRRVALERLGASIALLLFLATVACIATIALGAPVDVLDDVSAGRMARDGGRDRAGALVSWRHVHGRRGRPAGAGPRSPSRACSRWVPTSSTGSPRRPRRSSPCASPRRGGGSSTAICSSAARPSSPSPCRCCLTTVAGIVGVAGFERRDLHLP